MHDGHAEVHVAQLAHARKEELTVRALRAFIHYCHDFQGLSLSQHRIFL